jgi:integrase
MPRKLEPFVYRERTRHGKWVFYFRRGKGKRTRLPDPFTDEDAYRSAYLAAVSRKAPPRSAHIAAGSLAWLIERYCESGVYQNGFSEATRRQRDNIFKGVIKNAGHLPIPLMDKERIEAGLEARKHTPSQARNFLDAMKGLCRWAKKAGLIATDPTLGVENPSRPKGDGFPPWTDDDVAAYELRWAEGTKERVWLAVLLNTGLRRGDAVRLGRQHIKDGLIALKTEKTGTIVYLPVFADLERTVRIGPTGDLTFIVGGSGKPLTKESFGNLFRVACNKAGVAKSAHGLRKFAATRAAEHGLSVAELEAMFGWTGGTMASFYTKEANRQRLALSAAGKMGNGKLPAPFKRRPAP